MKRELDEALCKDFPLLFRDRSGNMSRTCMCWGFPGNGWEPLIRELAEKLEPQIQEVVDKIEAQGDPECICGKPRSVHENETGKCTLIFDVPKKFKFIDYINRLGRGGISCSIIESKKIKDILATFWWRVKNKISWKISSKLTRLTWFLCDKKIWYDKQPSWCKVYRMEHPSASQVKEKFGYLHFYLTSGTDQMWKDVHEAESKSCKTCEECGAPGKKRGGGWILTLCDQHAKENNQEELDEPFEDEEEITENE